MTVFRTLHGKLSLILLVLFLATASFTVLWTVFSVRLQLLEADQRLNQGLAEHLVREEFKEGELDDAGEMLERSFRMLMDINPNIELYLLDPEGRIQAFSAPPGRVVRNRVSIGPIRTYLSEGTSLPILGDDPRNPDRKKPFSAAEVTMKGLGNGYLYIILGGEKWDSFSDLFTGNAVFRLTLWISLTGLIFLFASAFLLFRQISTRQRKLVSAVEAFRKSEFSEPVPLPRREKGAEGDEISVLFSAFSEMSEKIIGQIKALRDKDHLRREMMTHITHDLRTPLASLQGYLETLSSRYPRLSRGEAEAILEKATRLISRLGRLVAEILELARLESPDARAQKEPLPLADLVNDVLMDYRDEAEEAGVALDADIPDEAGFVSGDIRLLERAVRNILDNAIRFTPRGGRVNVSLTREGESVELAVSDTGPGIDDRDLPHIFERFYRKDTPHSDAGFGLGLAVAQRIARLHGSGIRVRSAPGLGTTFSIRLRAVHPG